MTLGAEDYRSPLPSLQSAAIVNRDVLLGHGDARLRADLLDILVAGVRGADPAVGTFERVRLAGEILHAGDEVVDLREIDRVFIVGAGKASLRIAAALEQLLGERVSGGVVVVKRGETGQLSRVEVREAGHPLPDHDSVRGARHMLHLAQSAGPRDLVFLVVTGGASSLATLPPEGISLSDVATLTDLLLKCGATIREINTVRRHLCLLKGGRLVTAVQPARAITLTLDTAPEGLPWPDMCLPDPTTFSDAVAVLTHYGLWAETPRSIREYLESGERHSQLETLKSLEGTESTIVSVGDAASACRAAADHAFRMGYGATVLSTAIEGEARELGVFLAGLAKQMAGDDSPFPLPAAIVSGGETTVTISGDDGWGGPNQETALAFAAKVSAKERVAFAALDSDGTDGPTDIAGGLVDWTTREQAARLGIDLAAALTSHRSSEALMQLGGAICTGHTGTNVMNLRVLLVGDRPARSASKGVSSEGQAKATEHADSIAAVEGLEVLSGSGRPTVSATVRTERGFEAVSSVPSGTSKGTYEAVELVDGGDRYRGLGVRRAVDMIDRVIAPALIGMPVADQARVDAALLELDGTPNLSHLGGNAVLAASLAAARAGALSRGVPLYEHLGGAGRTQLPVPIATVLAGGPHSPSRLEIEDYILIPDGFMRFADAVEAILEVRIVLEELLCAKYGQVPDVGGALAPPIADTREAFTLMLEASDRAGYGDRMSLGVDVAASAFYQRAEDRYMLAGASRTRDDVVEYFRSLVAEFPLVFLEDAFDEDDFEGFRAMTAALPGLDIVGDDLFASNAARIAIGIERGAANAVLLKVNQIGTVSGALAAARLASDAGLSVTVSLRSSDTNDSFIADLAVGVAAKRIKLGSPLRGERNAKYNRLLAIEHQLGERARLAGSRTHAAGNGRTQEVV